MFTLFSEAFFHFCRFELLVLTLCYLYFDLRALINALFGVSYTCIRAIRTKVTITVGKFTYPVFKADFFCNSHYLHKPMNHTRKHFIDSLLTWSTDYWCIYASLVLWTKINRIDIYNIYIICTFILNQCTCNVIFICNDFSSCHLT